MHIFVDSRAPWDIIGGHAPQYPEFPPQTAAEQSGGNARGRDV
jgi:hypothetical protein